uniref:Kinesin light chain n=1 Tax=Chromera velia CCMP2878 TaxID=1169474 RepID=A0A0G4GF32_9ALVE|eukprot:Cvel_4619.t1-p1 / transcript=Cvel_4619.t1 / gene=Cvel_4619 / organism=Chromera_velia_CCMP2878 / gene_product=hypothetical protein / transcript_product=hypothetical protein / location=Cvel_scaffold203:50716-51819(-) / protein_length=368 / sequence_SO=supercontig / SO=protein_coding / is_pseudo=false
MSDEGLHSSLQSASQADRDRERKSDGETEGERDREERGEGESSVWRPETLHEKLISINNDAMRLQKDGSYSKMINLLEEVLGHITPAEVHSDPNISAVISSLFEKLVVSYNSVAMRLLKEGQYAESLRTLKQADTITQPHNSFMADSAKKVLKAVTFNNLGCYYKHQDQPHTAYQYLKKALAIETKLKGKSQNPAGTHLNICALLSHMGRHDEARKHAYVALKMLVTEKRKILGLEETTGFRSVTLSEEQVMSGANNDGLSGPTKAQTCTANLGRGGGMKGDDSVPKLPPSSEAAETTPLTAAYFNLAVECQHLRRYSEGHRAFCRALESCEAELGREHALYGQILRSIRNIEKKETHITPYAAPMEN